MAGDVGVDDVASANPTDDEPEPPVRFTAARWALIAFIAVEVTGFVTYLFIGRFMWFFGDEWGVLAGRTTRDALDQHGGHLIALPFLTFRALFFVFGLRSYLPYQLVVVVLHLVIAALLRAVIRRSGVGPWIATAAATLYVFFGAGGQNILWAFQMTLAGAVAFGLAQLLLADHDGPIDRRDWIGLGFGVLGVLCSGVAVTMVTVVGVAALLHGRSHAAIFHTVPLGALWLLWSLHYGLAARYTFTPSVIFGWDRRGLAATFRALGFVAPVGFLLAGVLVVGVGLTVMRAGGISRRTRLVLPLATLFGAFFFVTITGVSRAWAGNHGATSSRYLDVIAVLLLPAIAVAIDTLARRHRVLLAVGIVLLLVGIPGNISQTRDSFPEAVYFRGYRQMILSLPRMPLATRVPGSVHPEPDRAPTLTVSWLLDAAGSGRLPDPRASTPVERLTNILRLSLDQSRGSTDSNCQALVKPRTVRLRTGERFSVKGTIVIQLVQRPLRSSKVLFGAGFLTGAGEHKLVNVGGPVLLYISRAHTVAAVPSLCGVPARR